MKKCIECESLFNPKYIKCRPVKDKNGKDAWLCEDCFRSEWKDKRFMDIWPKKEKKQ